MRLSTIVSSALSAVVVSGRVVQPPTSPRDIAPFTRPLNTTAALGGFDATVPAWAAPPTQERSMYVPYPLASNDYWEKVKCHGQSFLIAMRGTNIEAGRLFAPARETAESTFSDTGALSKWNWQDTALGAVDHLFDRAWGVDHVLRAIDVSDKSVKEGGKIHVLSVTHGNGKDHGSGYGPKPYDKQPAYTVGDKKYPVTGAEYTFGIEPSGVLIAMDRKSPQFAGKERKPKVEGDQLPDLKSFSDVAWLKWKETTGAEPTTMRYFLTLSITNIDTRGVFGRILTEAKYTEVPRWPGYEVSADSDQGAALLGTPNAIAFSYFLIQHKSRLGNLRITRISLFKNTKKFPEGNMLFRVEPVPAEKKKIRSPSIKACL